MIQQQKNKNRTQSLLGVTEPQEAPWGRYADVGD
jgi:hypothetical protein